MTSDERTAYAREMLEKHPELFPEDRRSAILHGVVSVGMTPFEAHLAGGAFTYEVIADENIWPKHADPLKVMWAQSLQPDNSKVWMCFRNSSQFLGEEKISFRVYFEQGRSVRIEKLEG